MSALCLAKLNSNGQCFLTGHSNDALCAFGDGNFQKIDIQRLIALRSVIHLGLHNKGA